MQHRRHCWSSLGSPGRTASTYRGASATEVSGAHQIELWIWPGLDLAATTPPTRYVVLDDVTRLSLQYLGPALTWNNTWPTTPADPPLPLAVRMQVVLGSGETVVRVFALRS